jgi:hypothetical protein
MSGANICVNRHISHAARARGGYQTGGLRSPLEARPKRISPVELFPRPRIDDAMSYLPPRSLDSVSVCFGETNDITVTVPKKG